MAYFHIGCGPSCSCAGCQRTLEAGPRLGERYVEEERADPPPPAPPPPAPRAQAPTRSGLSGWHRLGEQPPLRGRPSLTGDLQLRMPPFATLTGFARGSPALNAGQIEQVKHVAEFIARSWTSPSPISSVRVTGYIDSHERQSDLGQLRANAVRDVVVQALNRLNPGLVSRLRWVTEDRGFSALAKVEIYLWAGPTPPPVPPLVRIPSPAEAARTVVPLGPETPEERIQRILRTLPPPPPQRRTLSQMFRQRVDGALDSAMRRVGVPGSLRGPIRAGVHAAIERGAETLLDRVLGASELGPEAKEAIKASVQEFFQVPIR